MSLRKNTLILKFLTAFGTCLILFLNFFSCSKNQHGSYQIKNALAWLQKNGGNFKNQKIGIKLINGKKSIGRLEWNKIKKYLNHGIKYFEIPFVFDNIGERIPMDTFAAYITYHLVIRENKNADYEGAIQITQVNTKMKTENNELSSLASLQFYYSLIGEPINSFMLQNGKSKVHNIRISSADAGKPYVKNFSINRNRNQQGGNG